MSRATTLVYDDAIDVPGDIGGLIGVPRFGSLLHQRRRLREHSLDRALRAGFTRRVHLRDPHDRQLLADEISQGQRAQRYVYLTSDLVAHDPLVLELHLAKVAYIEKDTVLRPDDAPPDSGLASLHPRSLQQLLSCRGHSQRRQWFRDRAEDLEVWPTDELLCLSTADALVRFLATAFHTRAFNQIAAGDRTIRKYSKDREKMRREHDFWYLLPPRLQRFVVQPYDFKEDDGGAGYSLERLGITDFAVLWVHGPEAVDDASFADFLDAIFDWFDSRPRQTVAPELARRKAEQLYRTKVQERISALLSTDTGRTLDRLVATGTAYDTGLQGLVDRYLGLLDREWTATAPKEPLAIMHGDLCFSNILFDKRSHLLRLIDPRGAERPDEIWDDPYYDIAKLSHSVLGGYDFIHHDLFDVHLNDDLRLELRSDRPEAGLKEQMFIERVRQAGFDPIRMRLYEASLFLSMLPLHADTPRKLAAFALTALQILEEVAEARAPRARGLRRLLPRKPAPALP